MKVLVTGAAGFLGSHLTEELIRNGHEVVGLDNYFTGTPENISQLNLNKSFKMINHDVTMPINVEVDFIANLACPASPIHYQKDPVQTLRTSVLGITNMLDLARKLGVPVFQASTSEVYGDPEISPQKESYLGNVNPIGIRACYDEGKRVAETLMFDYHRQYEVPIKIARIFNTYGPRMQLDDGRVVTNFIVQALRGEPITIYGDGSQTRSFCFYSDLIDGIHKLMFSPTTVKGPINLGNPVEFTILQLAQLVIEMTESHSELVFLELPGDDPKQRQPDISLAQKELGWSPKIKLEEGLGITIRELAARIKA